MKKSQRLFSTGPDYKIIDDEQVGDRSTGLIWTRHTLPCGRVKWSDAEAACAAVRIGGFTDWRWTTPRELLTIVDYERSDPAINTDVFQCESAFYWTSGRYTPDRQHYAWGVYFSSGYVNANLHVYTGFLRAVRVGQF